MAIPSVNQLSNLPGGGILASMNAVNDYATKNHLRKRRQIENEYLPDTLKAANMSKLAYANLMGPQFMAKLLANDSAVGNMGSANAKSALESIVAAARGQGGGNALNNIQSGHPTGIGQPGTNSISGWFMDKLKGAFGHGASSQQNGNALGGLASNPGQYNAPAQYASAPAPRQGQQPQPMVGSGQNQEDDGIDHEYDAFINHWLSTPEGKREIAKGEGANIPSQEEFHAMKRGNPSISMDMTGGRREPTYGEIAARYKGIQEEGKAEGNIRAKQRSELDDQYQQAVQAEVPMEHLNEIVTNPLFRQMRRDGLFQKLQLDAKTITGTPEEKQLIGDFQTTALKALSESIMGWKGRILDKEVGISNSMKVGPKDSIDSMLGKMPSIETFNEMTKQRARMASQIMRDQHISKGDALEIADRQVNGKAIREKINKQLNPKASAKIERPDFSKMSNEELQAYIGGE